MNILNIICNNIITALVLTWNIDINETHANIFCYQIFFYEEPDSGVPKTELWKEIINITARNLPMSCHLNKVNLQFFFTFENSLI